MGFHVYLISFLSYFM